MKGKILLCETRSGELGKKNSPAGFFVWNRNWKNDSADGSAIPPRRLYTWIDNLITNRVPLRLLFVGTFSFFAFCICFILHYGGS